MGVIWAFYTYCCFWSSSIRFCCFQNYRRVAEVWMDEYAEYLYKKRPHYRTIDPGDLTDQRAIRSKLKCKPFKWFMENVAFDLPKYYPPVEPAPLAHGEVREHFSDYVRYVQGIWAQSGNANFGKVCDCRSRTVRFWKRMWLGQGLC